jgi:hypothetical protein
MKGFLRLLLISSLLSLSINLFAADGSSGCGPGWYVLKENSLVSSALRLTTNGILFPSWTLGMTFGTSNCTQHKLVKTEQESLKYASENYYELIYSVAQGGNSDDGFLNQYSDVIGCDRNSLPIFKKEMRKNFDHIFPDHNANPSTLLKETYKVILSNKKLVKSCSLS